MHIFYKQFIMLLVLILITALLFLVTEKNKFVKFEKIANKLFKISVFLVFLHCAGISYYWILHPFVKKGVGWILSILI